jgi:hypothetical protein
MVLDSISISLIRVMMNYWAIRLLTSTVIYEIGSKMAPASPSSRFLADGLQEAHGYECQLDLAKRIMQVTPYCIDDSKGHQAAQMYLFSLRCALSAFRKLPGAHVYRDRCEMLVDVLTRGKGVRFAEKISCVFDGWGEAGESTYASVEGEVDTDRSNEVVSGTTGECTC